MVKKEKKKRLLRLLIGLLTIQWSCRTLLNESCSLNAAISRHEEVGEMIFTACGLWMLSVMHEADHQHHYHQELS